MWGLDWLYACISLAGQYFTGKKYWWGWVIQGLGQVVMGVISYQKGLYGMIVLAFCLISLYSWNLYKWFKGLE